MIAPLEWRAADVYFVATMNAPNIAIVGATGAVGIEILRVLERRNFPVGSLKLLASARSAGKTLEFKGKAYKVEELKTASFKGVDIAFFSAGAGRSREFAPAARAAGAVVIDNSSAFRMDPKVPLVVPEVNAQDLARHEGLIANPNCTAAVLATAVWPIHLAAGIRKIVVSTYQAASGAGAQAMQELEDQVREHAAGKAITRKVFPHQIAFNLFSHNTKVAENGYNEEENKVIEEMRKMFHMPHLAIVPTCIRVPVLRAHSEAITLELDRPLSPEEARGILALAPGVKLVDDRGGQPLPHAAGSQRRSRRPCRPHPPRPLQPQRAGAVRSGRPASERSGLERGSDRRGAGQAQGDGGGVGFAEGLEAAGRGLRSSSMATA